MSTSTQRPSHSRQPSLIPASTDNFLRLIASSIHIPYTTLPNISLAQPIILIQSQPLRFTLSYRGLLWSPEREESWRTFGVEDGFMKKTYLVYVWSGATAGGQEEQEGYDDLLMRPSSKTPLKRSGSYSSSSTLSSSSGGGREGAVSPSGSLVMSKRMMSASDKFTLENERFRDMLVETLVGLMSIGGSTAYVNNY